METQRIIESNIQVDFKFIFRKGTIHPVQVTAFG
jgi:hypothetical protein